MLTENIIKAAQRYRQFLPTAERFLEHAEYPNLLEQLKHCSWMCEEIISGNLKHEKAMRWLCFVQGCLWANGRMDIPSMKDDNRTPKD